MPSMPAEFATQKGPITLANRNLSKKITESKNTRSQANLGMIAPVGGFESDNS